MSVSKVAVVQDSKFRISKNNNNETSIFLPKEILEEMDYSYQEETEVSFYIFKEDFISALGCLMNWTNAPLFSKDNVIDLSIDFYIKALSDINLFFGTDEKKLYFATFEPNKSQALRGYLKNFQRKNSFNIRNYIIEKHTILIFSHENDSELRLETHLDEQCMDESNTSFELKLLNQEKKIKIFSKIVFDVLYEYDKFNSISTFLFEGKGVSKDSIYFDDGNLKLTGLFFLKDHKRWNDAERAFLDVVYSIKLNDGNYIEGQLSGEWYPTKKYRHINIETLIEIVNKYYKDIFYISKNNDYYYLHKLSLTNNESNNTAENLSNFTRNCFQRIYYGVPGSGKSFGIDRLLEKSIPEKELRDAQTKRVVFHPEYSNADFIGQILPKLNDTGIDYKFSAGPFTDILKKAYTNPLKKYFLIIEEINRGNAAAIFGDLFQLLDRDENTGFSSYSVNNDDVNYFVFGEGHLNEGIKLPPNLSILATMNTSDQNVFTLDNAFQRRWEMKLVENSFNRQENDTDETVELKKIQRNSKIETDPSVTWETFQTKINEKIGQLASETGLSSMEDKRLGCWFVKSKKVDGKDVIEKSEFAEKVLKYLWDDAFKFSREKVFGDYKNLEELTNKYKEKGVGLKVFNNAEELFHLSSNGNIQNNISGEEY